ncbi:MAG: hypothetical protein ACM359_06485 [Bacillota bacterium]
MFSFISGAKVASLLLLAGATVCFGLGPSRPDPQLLGGACPGCTQYPTTNCGDVKDDTDPTGSNHCCANVFPICGNGDGGTPGTNCAESEHHCSGLNRDLSPFCDNLMQGYCQ